MTLATKPHCKKHHIYTQGCIGCRIKAKQASKVQLNPDAFATPRKTLEQLPKPRHITKLPAKLKANTTYTIDSKLIDTMPDPTTELKTLLKAIYRDGAIGNTRSLDKDLETIRELI